MNDFERIQAAIPHRAPMLLVDEVVHQADRQIICRKTFRENEFFFQGHFPDHPIVPGVILCEAAMQAGAVLLSALVSGSTRGVPVATRLNDVKFKKVIRPGDQIEMKVQLLERLADAFFLKAQITCEGKVAVRFEFACTMASVA